MPNSLAFQAIIELMEGMSNIYLPLDANNPEEVRDAAIAIISLAMA